MKTSYQILIGIVSLLVVVGFVLGVWGFLKGLEEFRGKKAAEDIATSFQEQLQERGVQRIGQPIEGFDAQLLLNAFSGLQESDFDGVQAFEGVYRYRGGQLTFERTQAQPVSSAERTVSAKGYAALLANVADRLGTRVLNNETVAELLDTIGQWSSLPPQEAWQRVTETNADIVFDYPEELSTEYVRLNDWPPHLEASEDTYVCEPTESADGRTITEERMIMGKAYCVTIVSEGAAGTVYKNYNYRFAYDSGTAELSFALAFPQCENYAGEEQSACFVDQQAFHIDNLVERIRQTFATSITVEGTLVCLPHRDTTGPQTLECAFGLQDDDGDYYALQDLDSPAELGGATTDSRIEVTGAFRPVINERYQGVGSISVEEVRLLE